MSRTLRIILFGGVALAAWCFSSDQLLSRVATDDALDDGPASGQSESQNESDYQVVKLLSKLFTSIKRNHVEVLNLHRQYSRSGEAVERSDLRKQMSERIQFVEGKSREYAQLVPSLQQSYPGLKSVIQSFSRDLRTISGDLDLIMQTDGVGGNDTERMAGAPRRAKGQPRPEGEERIPPGDMELSHEARPQHGILSDALEHEREADRAGFDTPSGQTTEPRGGLEMGPGGPVVPITLEVRGEKGERVGRRKIVFQVADNKRAGMKGFVDSAGLTKEAIAFTDASGRAVVKLQLEQSETPLRIKRTIFPRDDHTVCLLESVEPK